MKLASHAMRPQQMRRCLELSKILSFKGGLEVGKCWMEKGSRDQYILVDGIINVKPGEGKGPTGYRESRGKCEWAKGDAKFVKLTFMPSRPKFHNS
jgi:hypothetical protein